MTLYRVLQTGFRKGSRRPSTHRCVWSQQTTTDLPTEVVDYDDKSQYEDIIEKKRNKSRLNTRHFQEFHKLSRQLTEDEEQAFRLSYQRKLYGLHGAASGINPAKLWPSMEEMNWNKEYERVSCPNSIHEMINKAIKLKEEEQRMLKQRQEDLVHKVAKLEGWKKEVRQRIEKQEKEAQEAKGKKERLIEEVRQILGYRIDPRDERFKEALLQKEQAERKASKAAKKLERQQRMIEKLKKAASNETDAKTTHENKPSEDSL
ncbi:growth arrest and DNA damage-inducible proteins-interacting protein 1-like [Homarus americanus]|uniref:Growth arrest and DNA damage-inducible proteins-interacting protein 1-like n=1 Tax=Homarus americanus TaxID=6706 RepID=A0A8J5JYN9_HOMAM|nr:growth arrest and DNA damage-inducible proteins-interacting protein 1-like [Homarus americanus]KAG7164418.1 growth arrest and DNA damage-inducible proteins-interacting protein 1-like [Homarus americanus]